CRSPPVRRSPPRTPSSSRSPVPRGLAPARPREPRFATSTAGPTPARRSSSRRCGYPRWEWRSRWRSRALPPASRRLWCWVTRTRSTMPTWCSCGTSQARGCPSTPVTRVGRRSPRPPP
ncbi:MAG: FIG024795: hypothetical protein, partial [uncultured Nocardioidaceae bacterium]